MGAASLLSFSTGFLSLSQEILWIRLFSFANHTLPQSFAYVLMVYLVGIALGAGIGKRLCNGSRDLWAASGGVLLAAGLIDAGSPWLYAAVAHSRFQILAGGILMALTALMKSIVF